MRVVSSNLIYQSSRMIHVIDDQPYLGDILSQIIQTFGYPAKTFTCPQDYIDHVQSPDFQIPLGTITDLHMPAMNGYEMMEQAHSHCPDIKFVVMTGETGIQHEYKSKACMYLTKPFHPDTVKNIILNLAKCSESSSSSRLSCAEIDDRASFAITNKACPHSS